MKRPSFVPLFAISSLSLMVNNAVANEQHSINLSQQLAEITAAKPVKRDAPKYPINEARNGHEGWVKVSFVIDQQGKVVNPIVESSSGRKSFEKQALAAVKNWRYSPAVENGETVEQCNNNIRLDFMMSDNQQGRVSKKFLAKFNKANQLISEGNFEQAKQQLDKIKDMKRYRLSEDFYYHLLLADYYRSIKQPTNELKALTATEVWHNKFYPEPQRYQLMQRLFALQVMQNDLANAFKSYKTLQKFPQFERDAKKYSNIKQQIDDFLVSDHPIVNHVNIQKGYPWHIQLVKNQFSLAQVKGDIHQLDIRCANKRHLYSFEPNNTWKIPRSWQQCSVYVKADDGSSFNFVQTGQQIKAIENTETTARL